MFVVETNENEKRVFKSKGAMLSYVDDLTEYGVGGTIYYNDYYYDCF